MTEGIRSLQYNKKSFAAAESDKFYNQEHFSTLKLKYYG